jgi:hypothetical protein
MRHFSTPLVLMPLIKAFAGTNLLADPLKSNFFRNLIINEITKKVHYAFTVFYSQNFRV